MASTFVPINVAVLASETDLYTAFSIGGATTGTLLVLNLCNTGTVDLTIDVYYKKASDSSKKYLAKTRTVPALGNLTLEKAGATINTSTDKWCAIASATGIDAVGTVIENA